MYESLRVPLDLASAVVGPDALAEARDDRSDTLRSPATLANPRVPNAADVAGLLDVVGPDLRSMRASP